VNLRVNGFVLLAVSIVLTVFAYTAKDRYTPQGAPIPNLLHASGKHGAIQTEQAEVDTLTLEGVLSMPLHRIPRNRNPVSFSTSCTGHARSSAADQVDGRRVRSLIERQT